MATTDTTTRTLTEDAERPTAPPGWELLVAYHPDPRRVGARVALAAGEPLIVGRRADVLGAGVLDDETLSRKHARFVARVGGVELEDLDSRNGTLVNGASIKRQTLKRGDVVGVGRLLLLVGRAGRAVHDEQAAEITRVAPLSTTVMLVGETGTGKSRLATALHEASGRRGALVTLPCGALAPDLVPHELFGVAEGAMPGTSARPGLVERAHGGTLLLDGVDDAPPELQAALLSVLESGEVRRVGATESTPVEVRVVATAASVSPAGVRPELLARLGRFVVTLPPLRERVEELPLLVRDLVRRRERWVTRALMQALLRHGYPHNVRELESLVERAAIDAGDEPLINLSPAVAVALGVADDAPSPAFAAAADGTWFRPPGEPRVSLRRRENLARLFRALLAEHRERPGHALDIDELFRAGWPGERIQPQAAAGRVYVALTTLRNLGLRDVLQRGDGGYHLDAAVALELHDPPET